MGKLASVIAEPNRNTKVVKRLFQPWDFFPELKPISYVDAAQDEEEEDENDVIALQEAAHKMQIGFLRGRQDLINGGQQISETGLITGSGYCEISATDEDGLGDDES